jgi:hypothetical protein
MGQTVSESLRLCFESLVFMALLAETGKQSPQSIKTSVLGKRGFRQLHILIPPPRQAMEMTECGKNGKP